MIMHNGLEFKTRAEVLRHIDALRKGYRVACEVTGWSVSLAQIAATERFPYPPREPRVIEVGGGRYRSVVKGVVQFHTGYTWVDSHVWTQANMAAISDLLDRPLEDE